MKREQSQPSTDRIATDYVDAEDALLHSDEPASGTGPHIQWAAHESGDKRRVGPVFSNHDFAVRLATCDQPEVPAEAMEVAP